MKNLLKTTLLALLSIGLSRPAFAEIGATVEDLQDSLYAQESGMTLASTDVTVGDANKKIFVFSHGQRYTLEVRTDAGGQTIEEERFSYDQRPGEPEKIEDSLQIFSFVREASGRTVDMEAFAKFLVEAKDSTQTIPPPERQFGEFTVKVITLKFASGEKTFHVIVSKIKPPADNEPA